MSKPTTSTWFRVHNALVDDPKVRKLPDHLVASLLFLWCIASENGGTLPDIDDVAFKLRTTAAKAAETITRLVKAGLIDETETGFAPHNWSGRQYKTDAGDPTNAERQKKFQARRRQELRELKALRDASHNSLRNGALYNGVSYVTAKRPDTDTDTDNKTTTVRVEREATPVSELTRADLDAIYARKQ